MNDIYITNIFIKSLIHLKNTSIPLSSDDKKNLIITGKNGCGKTSLLEALSVYLESATTNIDFNQWGEQLNLFENQLSDNAIELSPSRRNHNELSATSSINLIKKMTNGLDITFNKDVANLYRYFNNGQFILAYYSDNRIFNAEISQHVEKIELNTKYSLKEKPSAKFVKYLVDMKVTEALYMTSNQNNKATQIKKWFESFEELLRKIFNEKSLNLVFTPDSFEFHITIHNRNAFDFNSLSSGYAAILDIIVDIIMRMEKKSNRKFEYTMPGIVLIDEIETHLHLELQKNILGLLTTVFPNIQFIVSTHSPFILNSIENVTIFDLENKTHVSNGLVNIPYDGIVDGYFNIDTLSNELKEKFNKYKELVNKETIEDEDFASIARLQMYLEEIPDYLALDITTEYQRLRLEFEGRSDLQ